MAAQTAVDAFFELAGERIADSRLHVDGTTIPDPAAPKIVPDRMR